MSFNTKHHSFTKAGTKLADFPTAHSNGKDMLPADILEWSLDFHDTPCLLFYTFHIGTVEFDKDQEGPKFWADINGSAHYTELEAAQANVDSVIETVLSIHAANPFYIPPDSDVIHPDPDEWAAFKAKPDNSYAEFVQKALDAGEMIF